MTSVKIYKALCVKQPLADDLTRAVFRDENGEYHAEREAMIFPMKTDYRGDVLICSSKGDVAGHQSGVTCGMVELYDVKMVEDMTEAEWKMAGREEGNRPDKGYGWLFRNPRRVVEMPARVKLGFHNIKVEDGILTEYPRALALGADGWEAIKKKIRK